MEGHRGCFRMEAKTSVSIVFFRDPGHVIILQYNLNTPAYYVSGRQTFYPKLCEASSVVVVPLVKPPKVWGETFGDQKRYRLVCWDYIEQTKFPVNTPYTQVSVLAIHGGIKLFETECTKNLLIYSLFWAIVSRSEGRPGQRSLSMEHLEASIDEFYLHCSSSQWSFLYTDNGSRRLPEVCTGHRSDMGWSRSQANSRNTANLQKGKKEAKLTDFIWCMEQNLRWLWGFIFSNNKFKVSLTIWLLVPRSSLKIMAVMFLENSEP